jgi:signal transduction histidine kinase
MGLGLSIARDLARAMNGEVWLESVVGAGCTAWLTLPSV